jgi:hypothetical protein
VNRCAVRNAARAYIALFLMAICASAPARAAETPEMYAAWRDHVVQIQVIDDAAGSKAGTGSGFVAGRPDWIVSNYHVIAELVNSPGEYRARFVAENGTQGELDVIAVDAVHDLALLQAPVGLAEPLPLAGEEPPRGSRLWSMGYPYDIGLTIVEGTYNGMLEKSLYEKLHFTGSINPGMSGGPAFDGDGAVVGVNVATAGNQVSFLVPVRFAGAMLKGAESRLPGRQDLNQEVARQLLENQDRITDELLARRFATTRLGSFRVPAALAGWFDCWGDSQDEPDDELDIVSYRCETQDDIFLSDQMKSGVIQYQHDRISSGELGSWRFYHQLESLGYYPLMQLGGEEDSVTNYRCRSDFVDQQGLPLKVTWCVRRYLKLEGLYDAYLEATSLSEPREALQSGLLLAGFSWKNLERLSTRFLESISMDSQDGKNRSAAAGAAP